VTVDLHAHEDSAADARAARVARRLRQNTIRGAAEERRRVPSFALEHTVAGDLGHLHAAHDLRSLPFPSRHRLTRPLVVRTRRLLRRALYPLPEAQSVWNGANARVVTFLLRQLVAQARAIESLEEQVSALHDQLDR
jgi:hypothetical protein